MILLKMIFWNLLLMQQVLYEESKKINLFWFGIS